MGLVQSQTTTDNTIAVEGVNFRVEQNLKRFIPLYGNILVDFKKTFLGAGFTVNFSRPGSC